MTRSARLARLATARLATAILIASCAFTSVAAAAQQDQGANFVQPGADKVEVAAAEPAVQAPNQGKGPMSRELTVTLLGGPYRGPVPNGNAAALELGLGIGWTSFVVGARFSLGTLGQSFGYGFAAQLGPRFQVSDQVSLELLADAGLQHYSSDQETDLIIISTKSEGSSVSLPAVGLRAGLMLLRNSGKVAVTFGLLARWTRSETVGYQSGICLAYVVCGTGAREATYGGSMYGAYLTVTGLRLVGS